MTMPVTQKKGKTPIEFEETPNDQVNPQFSVLSHRADIKDYICPFKIDTRELNYVKIISRVQRFVRSFFVSTLPRFLSFGDFLKPLYNFPNSNTSVYVYPINEGTAQNNLNAIINQLEGQRLEAVNMGDENKEKVITQKKLEAEALRDEIATNFNKLFEVSILSSTFAKSLEELDNQSDMLGMEMAKNTISIKSTWSQQDEALKSNIPYCNNMLKRNNTFDSFGLAAAFPFVCNDISHPNGVPIGINKKSNLPVFLDNFNPSFNNFNFVLFGKIASGKRVAVQLLTARSCVSLGIQNIALDAEGRYGKIAKLLGGISITITPASRIIINPFDIEVETIRDDITGKERTVLNLQNKIDDVTNILATMARGAIKSQYINDVTKKIIREIVAEAYESEGITTNPDSLYSSTGANLIGTRIVRSKKTLPTIGSWYKRLCKKAEANTNLDYKYHYEYLVKYMQDYVADCGGSIPYYDGQTTLDVDADTPYVNFDLSKLDIRFAKPLAYQVLLSWIWERLMKANSEGRSNVEKKRVVIDETWMLLDFVEAVDFLNALAERAAKRNVSLSIISQRFDAFYKNPKLNKILLSASVKLFMQQTESEIDYLKETFKLTNGERDFLATCMKGEGILQVGTSSAQIYIAPTGYEIELLEANPSNFMLMGGEANQG